jgi:hypothetical protein
MLMLLLYTALRLIFFRFFRFRVCFGELPSSTSSCGVLSPPPKLRVIGMLLTLPPTATDSVTVDEDVWDPSLFAVTDSVEFAESPGDLREVTTATGDADDAELDVNNDVVWDAGTPGDLVE